MTVAATNKKEERALQWDKQSRLLLCCCIVVHGTEPAKIKELKIFQGSYDAEITRQIEKILMLKCGQTLRGVAFDPFRLQSFVHGQLLLVRRFDPARWVDPAKGYLLLYPFSKFDKTDGKAMAAALKAKTSKIGDWKRMIRDHMAPS